MVVAEPGDRTPHPVFDHEGPWTEEAFLALPESGRIELLDGSLLVTPTAGPRHGEVAARVRSALAAALPPGLVVRGPVDLRLTPGRILVPDLVVVGGSPHPDPGPGPVTGGTGNAPPVRDAGDVLMVIEIVARGNALVDRAIKPQLYAEVGIPYYLRVDQDGPAAAGHQLVGGRYLEYARSAAGERLVLDHPFRLDADLAPLPAPARTPTPTPVSGPPPEVR